jgi:AmmeMemoRadiSam system protein B
MYHGRVAPPLPPLRQNLDLMPSPVRERPGLLMRDPFRYTEDTLIIPPALIPFLGLFDGAHDELDLAEALVRATGEIEVQGVVRHLVDTLGAGGFLANETLERLREERQRAFTGASRREPVHAGTAYPAEPAALAATLGGYLAAGAGTGALADLRGIAAPHVSPEGGWRSYGAAYGALGSGLANRTFVILGTSHYGEPGRFGLTRKPFATPLGECPSDQALVERLEREGGPAVRFEDYCHAVEHSIEFQVVFLQQVFGREIRILPILCGPLLPRARPEDDEGVRRFLDVLSELAVREERRLFWVLGVDMAHMGRRYGDAFVARADQGEMAAVAERDRERISRLAGGDAEGFWDLVEAKGDDDLKWCGASPFYTFLRAAGPLRGELLRYEQWNIDPESVVTFAGMAFAAPGAAPPKGAS